MNSVVMTIRPPRLSQSRSRGVALVIVMWVVIVAGLMLLGVMRSAQTHWALAHEEFGAVEAHWLARAGVEQAMAVLEDDDPTSDTPAESWYQDTSVFEKIELGSGTFTVHSAADDGRAGLDDESGRLNLNAADKKQLTELKTLSDMQIDSLIDWRTPNDVSSGDGAKAGYYQHLEHPYELRGKELQTQRELLLVRGFEDRSFFGKPGSTLAAAGPASQTTVYSYTTNLDPQGAARVNFNTVPAQTLQERFNFSPQLAQAVVQQRATQQFQNLSALLEVRPPGSPGSPGSSGSPGRAAPRSGPGSSNAPSSPESSPGGAAPLTQITLPWVAQHAEEISVSDDSRLPAKLNINTASREVLMSLPGLSEELADRIVADRSSSNGGFASLADVLERHLLSDDVFRAVFEKLTVRSDVFSVESVGVSASGVQRRILAVIDRGSSPMSILYWYQTP